MAKKELEALLKLADIYSETKGEANALIGAEKASRIKGPKLPLDLISAPLKSKQEINDIAERIARQQLGEHVTSGVKGDTKNLAGRSAKENKRIQDTVYNLERSRQIDPTQEVTGNVGDINQAVIGDSTISDYYLLDANGIPINSKQEGGPRYGLGKKDDPNPPFWASNLGGARPLQNKVNKLSQLYNTDQIMGHHLAMGPTANNFAMHFADANMKAITNSDIGPESINAFNQVMQDKHPTFPGIHKPEESMLAMRKDSEMRKYFNNRMKIPSITEPLGLPNGLDIQWAISEPDLRNMEIAMSGHSVGRLKPGAELIEDADHGTYTHKIPGEFLGHAPEIAPWEIAYPDADMYLRSVYEPENISATLQKVAPHQVVNENYLNQLNEYYTRLRDIRGFKDGGSIEDNIKDKIKDFYRKWKDSATEMFGDYPMPLESSSDYKDTTPSPRMGPEGTTIYSKSHYAQGGSIEDDYKLADMFTADPESGGLNYRDYPNPHGVRAFPIKDKQGNVTGYGGEEIPKYEGWLGPQEGTGKLKGSVVTEYSSDDAKGSFPTMNPLLTQTEREQVASGNVTPAIYEKSVQWRDYMVSQGKSPFYNPEGFAQGGMAHADIGNPPPKALAQLAKGGGIQNIKAPSFDLPSAEEAKLMAELLARKAYHEGASELGGATRHTLPNVALKTLASFTGAPADIANMIRPDYSKPNPTREILQRLNIAPKTDQYGKYFDAVKPIGSENLINEMKSRGLITDEETPMLDTAAMLFGPGAVGKLAKLTEGLPVGLSIKDVSKVPFTSTLNKTVSGHKMETMPGPQWSSWLKSNAPKSANKEADATGLHDWLATQPKVSKADIVEHVEGNLPKIKVVTRGSTSKLSTEDNERLKDLTMRRSNEGSLSPEEYTDLMRLENIRDKHSVGVLRGQQREQERSAQQAQARGDNATANMRFNIAEHLNNRADALELNPEEMGGGTKFNTWQLPGGENYKETLLSLPTPMNEYNEFVNKLRAKYGAGGFDSLPLNNSEKATLENLYEKEGVGVHTAPSAHSYGDPESDINRVAHIRTNERPTAEGKRALFVEELQSDWGQQGYQKRKDMVEAKAKELGITKEEASKLVPQDAGFNKKETERIKGVVRQQPSGDWAVHWDDGSFSGGYSKSSAEEKALEGKSNARTGVPTGPYVTDTKDWTALGLKHALKQAVDEGHDYLAWTNGEQQANRYDLSKHIDRVDHDMNPDGTYNLSAVKDGQEVFSQEDIPAEQLAEHVGKEVAEKIIKGEGKAPTAVGKWEPVEGEGYRNWKSLSGLDLQVGGEGMKGYYDKIVPQTMNDIMKQIGVSERVKPINFKPSNMTENEWESYLADKADVGETAPPHVQQGIEITPELRDKVLTEGLPHFHTGGEAKKINKHTLEELFRLSTL